MYYSCNDDGQVYRQSARGQIVHSLNTIQTNALVGLHNYARGKPHQNDSQ